MLSFNIPARFTGALAIVGLSSLASAATLVDYKPGPVSPTTPEFVFGGGPVPSFQTGPGAIGNGDGALPQALQTPGGLDSETPFLIPAVPGSQVGVSSTKFFDSTLNFAGLAANAPAINAGGTLIQSLGPGSFQLLSTTGINLLTGTISTSTFIVGAGGAGATFNASGVNYTGGLIFNALVAAGGDPNANSMSISMTDVSPTFSINGASGFLNDFTANATGLFNVNVIPEPGAVTGAAILAGAVLRTRRSRRA